jgi:hypothetical protein
MFGIRAYAMHGIYTYPEQTPIEVEEHGVM